MEVNIKFINHQGRLGMAVVDFDDSSIYWNSLVFHCLYVEIVTRLIQFSTRVLLKGCMLTAMFRCSHCTNWKSEILVPILRSLSLSTVSVVLHECMVLNWGLKIVGEDGLWSVICPWYDLFLLRPSYMEQTSKTSFWHLARKDSFHFGSELS